MSIPNTIKVRLIRYLRYAAWSVLFPLGALSIGYFCFLEYSRYTMRAMNHTKLSPTEFDRRLGERLKSQIYLANKSEPHYPVTFHLDMGLSHLDNTVLIIESSKVFRSIYRGPYQREFIIQAGQDLLGGSGADDIEIVFYKKDTHEVFIFGHESTRIWQANKHVHIELLPFRELNEIGLPVAFKVRIE